MAESAVSFIAEKLCNLLLEEIIFLQGVRDEVEWMERQLRWMQTFLRDADARQRGHGVAYWVRQIRELAYDAEDIVDTYILNTHRHQVQNVIKRYACCFRKLPMHHNIGMQIEWMKTRVKEIYKNRVMYGNNYSVGGAKELLLVDKTVKERRDLAIWRDMNIIVGFEDDRKNIMKVLLDDEKKKRCVISIVGMGGVGKSTLARSVCNDSLVKEKFSDRCALVTVSQSYTINKVLKDIAEQLPTFERESQDADTELRIKVKLPQFLEGGKYLIVLDDVWGAEVWALIQHYLPDKENGSRVIITTRSMDVAISAEPSMSLHRLKPLNEEKSWDLFTKIVFPGEEVRKVCLGEIEKLGKDIVNNCGGLPLALVVVGGLLSMKERSLRVWQNVKEEFDWQEISEGEVSLKILALSYEALPHHLKTCFLYFGCFPKGFVIDAEKLIRLWVAEGFIPDEEKKQQRRKSRTMEEIAESWLQDLIQRCLVQGVEISPTGRVLECRVHDLLLDLAINEGEEVNFFHTCQDANSASIPGTTRRLALHPNTDGYKSLQFYTEDGYKSLQFSTPKLRTFLSVNSSIVRSLKFLRSLELLRVLDLEDACTCKELPSAIGDLIHLRYLGLRSNILKSIPSSIRKLQNLQIFDIRESSQLEELPSSLWGFETLRHVFIDDDLELRNVGKNLLNLQTLKEAKAGNWIHMSLATMRNLRQLEISSICPTHHLALALSLDNLVHLRSLRLVGECDGTYGPLPRKALALPKHFQLEELSLVGPLVDPKKNAPPTYTTDELPPNLNKLELHHSKLQQDPLSLLEKLSYLRCLRINNHAYVGEEMMCTARGFPQLEALTLDGLDIKRWKVEEGAMPCLNNLVVRECSLLEKLPVQLEHIPTGELDSYAHHRRHRPPWGIEELKQRKIRAHAQVIRAALLFKEAGERLGPTDLDS